MSIHPTAVIDSSARLADNVEIGPYVVIGADVEIGPECVIMAGAAIHAHTRMGRGNRVHPHAILGGDPQYLGFNPATKSGLIIGDKNEFRELCTVHRGLKDGCNTTIGNENFLMATSHVAHDCALGNNTVLANGSLLAGHVTVGDRAFVSGICAVHQYTRIGRLAMLGGMTGIGKDLPPFLTCRGGNFAFLVGVNVIGLRRAGVGVAARTALRNAFRELFRSGHALNVATKRVREMWQGSAEPMPPELDELLVFCETRSKRGILSGASMVTRALGAAADEDDGSSVE